MADEKGMDIFHTPLAIVKGGQFWIHQSAKHAQISGVKIACKYMSPSTSLSSNPLCNPNHCSGLSELCRCKGFNENVGLLLKGWAVLHAHAHIRIGDHLVENTYANALRAREMPEFLAVTLSHYLNRLTLSIMQTIRTGLFRASSNNI